MFTTSSEPTIIRKVAIPETLLAIPPHTLAVFRARTFAPYGSVRSAITRLNAGHADPQFTCSTSDNGETFSVKRHF